MRALVTGAAGFIASHVVDSLLAEGWEVIGADNLSAGTLDNLKSAMAHRGFSFEKLDLRSSIPQAIGQNLDSVFHFAADPEVRTGLTLPESQFENNILATYHILEMMRKCTLSRLYFASSSTVYGEPNELPTPESYSPLSPISIYGSAKLACENMILGYCNTFGFRAVILRPANVVGGRGTHGVLLDFLAKLRKNPSKLEILGDGKQSKSYVHPDDIVRAISSIDVHSDQLSQFEVFNIGNEGRTSVVRIAEIVSEEMHLSPEFSFTGGIDGGRAWKGDVRTVLLSIDKIKALGWRPFQGSDNTIRRAVRERIATYPVKV